MSATDPPAIVQPSTANDQSDVIEVVGIRRDQVLKIDRRTFEVQQNPHTAQKDSVQLLRGLPAVTVTPDDQVLLLGSAGVTIQVDGRTVTDPDRIAFLRTLHGSDIERIEVITNPSAQYGAQGTGGIINFVLRKKQGEGISGNASAELTSLGHGYVDGTRKLKHGKWTYEIHTGGRFGTASRSTYHKLRSVEELPGGTPTINTERGGAPSRGSEVEGSAKISYEADPRTSVSALILGAPARDVGTHNVEFAGLTPDFQSFTEHQRFSTAASYVIAELNFDHKGKKDGETLTASLRAFATPRQHEANSAEFSNGGTLSTDKRKRFLFTECQIDWQHPMAKGQILSLGGLRNSNRISEHYSFASTNGPLGPPVFDQFRGAEDELAAYATFQQPIGTWTLMPGVRVERNSRHVTSPGKADVDIARTYLFPTLHVQHPLGRTIDLTLSYGKRIDRPSLNDLRPYPLVQDVLTIKEGNPHLKDQLTDSYEMNLQYHRKKVTGGIILYDRETRNLESSSYSVINGVNVFTLITAGRRRDRGAELDLSMPVVKRVKLSASLNLFDERVPVDTAAATLSESSFRYTTNATIEWDAPDRGKIPGDTAQLQWIYSSPERLFQIHDAAWNWLSLSYTHSFNRTLALTGTLNYQSRISHRLIAPLVQEYFAEHRPVEFKLKLLKTFGNPK
ncbi:MAG: TonB-dependent receptor domain-containing protein [Sphingomicrobium sp.]